MSLQDKLQVRAFRAFFKSSEGTPEEKFARAIAITSDNAFEKIKDKPQIQRWIERFSKRKDRK